MTFIPKFACVGLGAFALFPACRSSRPGDPQVGCLRNDLQSRHVAGMSAPDVGYVHKDVKKGWAFLADDKLCWKRSSDPEDCESPMTAWKCVTSDGPGKHRRQPRLIERLSRAYKV